MNRFPLLRIIRYAFSKQTTTLEPSPVAANKDDGVTFYAPADRFTDWPPQPMTAWFES